LSVDGAILSTPAGREPEMVDVPAGKVKVCDLNDQTRCERRRVKGFRMDSTEVTTGRFARFANSGGCERKLYNTYGHSTFCNLGAPGRENHPMNCVTFMAARDYCKSLGKRLPTLEEWLLAARGADDRKFPWGDEAPDCTKATYHGKEGRGCGNDFTVPVGSFPSAASPFGILDMAGNVMEWTVTIAVPPAEDPEGKEIPIEENPRTKRFHLGGSFADGPQTMELDFLCFDSAKQKNISLGIRCVE